MTSTQLDGAVLAPSPFARLADAFRDAPNRFPDGQFQFFGAAGEPMRLSFADTFTKAERVGAALQAKGVAVGDGVILAVEEPAAFVAALWACLLIGATIAPLTSHLRRAKGTGARAGIIGLARAKLGGAILLSDDPAQEGALTLADLTNYPNGKLHDTIGSPRVAILTSGTSGAPKLALLGEAALLARWWPSLPEPASARAFLSWSPFDHVMGLGLCAPNLPRKVHLKAEAFAANSFRWLDVVQSAGITHATMTNFGLSLLVKALESDPARRWTLDKVARIGVGAEDISADLCARFLKLLAPSGLRGDALILGYGLTECGPVVGGSTPFSPGSSDGGAVVLDGATPGHSLRILGPDGQILQTGETGRIEVCGPTLFSGYLGDASTTEAAWSDDGWLRTGDLGVVTDGRLTVTGRAKDIVLINAHKYSCTELERGIQARIDFAEIIAVPLAAVPVRRGKDAAVFAVVDPTRVADWAEAIAAVRKAVAEAFQFAPEVVALIASEDVPRTALGKINRTELAAKLELPDWGLRIDRLIATEPRTKITTDTDAISRCIADVFSGILKCPTPDADADFYELGGDSLLALQMCFALEKALGVPLPRENLPDRLSIASLAQSLRFYRAPAVSPEDGLPQGLLGRMRSQLANFPSESPAAGGLVRLAGGAEKSDVPIFWCLQNGSEASSLGLHTGAHRPVYVMRSGRLLIDYATPAAAALARAYTAEIKQIWPGPYVLGGNCQGAILALAIARQLMAEGRDVRLFAAADTVFPDLFGTTPLAAPTALFSARRSKFNPGRRYRHPVAGLRKWLPAGLRHDVIESDYAKILFDDAMAELAASLEDAILWAGERKAISGPMPPVPRARYAAQYGFFGPEQKHSAGEKWLCTLALHNPGPWPWAPFAESGLTICHRWLTAEGELLALPGGCELLDGQVGVGDFVDAEFEVTSPPSPGLYRLEIDLVEEGVCWFSERYAVPLQLPVTVTSDLAAPGRWAGLWSRLSFRPRFHSSSQSRPLA